MPAPQSNLIAPWLKKVIQQTMVANAGLDRPAAKRDQTL